MRRAFLESANTKSPLTRLDYSLRRTTAAQLFLSAQSRRQKRTFLYPPSNTMADRRTLVRPPPLDPMKSAIENVLELTELKQIGPVSASSPLDIYQISNTQTSISPR